MTYDPPPNYPPQRPSPGGGSYGPPPGGYPPPPSGYGPPAKPKRPWWQQWWAIVIAAFIVLFVGVGIGGASSTTSTSSKPGPTVTATATTVRTAPGATVTAHPVIRKVVRTKTRTATVTYTPPVGKSYGDGTFVVGQDIDPGTYHAAAHQGYCAWFRASDKSGSNLIDAGNTTGGGPLTVVVEPSDGALVLQGDCVFHKE